MEAKDTVMPEEGRIILSYMNPEIIEAALTELLNKQAEISFRAGREAEREFILQNTDRDIRARKEGIREVVEWVKAHSGLERCDPDVMPYFVDYLMVDYPDWQAKLKEWD